MNRRVLVALVALCAPSVADAADDGILGSQLLDAEALRAAGVFRLGEILRVADDWDVTTIDGYKWRAAPRGLGFFEHEDWELYVDGEPVELGHFGARDLHRLPIDLAGIDRVELTARPGVVAGRFADRASVHVRTHRPAPGLHFTARYAAGSETGDPGPFEYTPGGGENVERTGFESSASLSYGRPDTFGTLSLVVSEHQAADAAIARRLSFVTSDDPFELDLVAPRLTASARVAGRWQRVTLARSRFDDERFWEPNGREIPVEARWTRAGVAGELHRGRRARVDYRANHFDDQLARRPGAQNLDFEWRQRTTRLDLLGAVEGARAAADWSLGVERLAVDAAAPIDGDRVTTSALTASVRHGNDARARGTHSLSLTTGGGSTVLRLASEARVALSPAHRVGLSAAYVETPARNAAPFWYWTERGYGFADEAGVDWEIDGTIAGSVLRTAELAWESTLAAGHRAGGALRLSSVSGAAIEEHDYEWVEATDSFTSPTRVRVDRSGRVASASLVARPRLSARASLELRYRWQEAYSGDADFRARAARIPRHQTRSRFRVEVSPGLVLGAVLRYRSRADWVEYGRVAVATGGRYEASLPAHVGIDLTVQKSFWKKRLRVGAALSNVTDRPIAHHPIGTVSDLAFVIRTDLSLGPSPR